MKKVTFSFSLAILLLDANAAEVSSEIRDREHSVRDVVDEVGKQEVTENKTTAVNMEEMFKKGSVSGQVRSIYSSYNLENAPSQYATAIGGQLKFETAKFNGFSAGVEFTTSHDLNFATGEDTKHNAELSSSDGHYTEASQAYLNYKYKNLELRAGRQLLETPLADSDDIRMIPNTFKAYTATYTTDTLTATGGLIMKWQGNDTGLNPNHQWSNTGEDGTYLGGVKYATDLVDIAAWYYDISKDEDPLSATGNVANSSFYTDASLHLPLAQDVALHTSAQYLKQDESENSAIKSNIYGAMAEIILFEDFAFSVAYNKATKEEGKRSFSGFGGGALYTSMNSMILDAITADRDADAVVTGMTYKLGDFGFMYVYGNFKGDADSLGQKEHIVEQNIGFEYKPNENLTIAAIYVKNQDKEKSGSNNGNWENARVLASYSF